MKEKLFLFSLFGCMSLGLSSQQPTLELTFNAVENTAYVQLESIKIMNRAQGGDTVLFWPDTGEINGRYTQFSL